MRRLINILLFIVLAIGCRKESPIINGVEVSISLSSVDISQTKADDPLKLREGATVRVLVYHHKGNTLLAERTLVVNGEELNTCDVDALGGILGEPTKGNSIYLPQSGTYDFYAISPAISTTSNIVKVSDKTEERQFLYSKTEAKKIDKSNNLNSTGRVTLTQLSHKYSQIQMDVRLNPYDGDDAAMGTKGVIFTNQTQASVLFPLEFSIINGNFVSLPNPGLPSASLTLESSKFSPQNTPALKPAVKERFKLIKPEIIFPTKVGNVFTITSHLTIGKNDVELITKDITLQFLPGSRYTFMLSVDDKGIVLFLQVTPWASPDDWSSNFGSSITFILGGWMADPQDYTHGVSAGYENLVWCDGTEWTGDFDGTIILPKENITGIPWEGPDNNQSGDVEWTDDTLGKELPV